MTHLFDGRIGRMREENIRRFCDGASPIRRVERRHGHYRPAEEWEGSGGIASLFAMGMSSLFITSFAAAAAVVVLIVVFVGDVTVAVVGAVRSFVATPGGDATRRLSMSIASSAFWMVCGLWVGGLRGL